MCGLSKPCITLTACIVVGDFVDVGDQECMIVIDADGIGAFVDAPKPCGQSAPLKTSALPASKANPRMRSRQAPIKQKRNLSLLNSLRWKMQQKNVLIRQNSTKWNYEFQLVSIVSMQIIRTILSTKPACSMCLTYLFVQQTEECGE